MEPVGDGLEFAGKGVGGCVMASKSDIGQVSSEESGSYGAHAASEHWMVSSDCIAIEQSPCRVQSVHAFPLGQPHGAHHSVHSELAAVECGGSR